MSTDSTHPSLIVKSADADVSSTNTPASHESPASPRSIAGVSLGLPRGRPAYSRLASSDEGAVAETDEGENIADTFRSQSTGAGLGIGRAVSPTEVREVGQKARRVSIQAIPRKSVGSAAKSPSIASPPISPFGQGSPQSSRVSFGNPSSAYEAVRSIPEDASPAAPPVAETYGHRPKASVTSIPDDYESRGDYADNIPLRRNAAHSSQVSLRSVKSGYEVDFDPRQGCPAAMSFEHTRFNWLGVSIFALSIFSTVFSGIYLAIALRGPRYGHFVGTNANLSASTASILVTLFAKLIELSYVTVFVAFVGQALSRRAFSRRERGVSLAELFMRMWVMQPGSMITNFQTLRYAALTFLGAISLTATFSALLYTTAADALVAPQLRFSDWEDTVMQSRIMTGFGNSSFLQKNCAHPIQNDVFQNISDGACTQIVHAANAYNNYKVYLSTWHDIEKAKNGSSDIALRPKGFALLNENTTVIAPWVEHVDVKAASEKAGGRIVNNVSLAMPHAGVSLAAYDQRNNILQPKDLDGLGVYGIRASVISPVINVLCANVEDDDIAPIIYNTSLDGRKNPISVSEWIDGHANFTTLNDYKIKTPLDDLFEWGPQYGQHPPMFYKAPIEYNTVLNQTFSYGRHSIYLLGKGGNSTNNATVLCRFRASMTPFCSTHFNATSSGARMEAHCEDPNDPMAYFHTNATSGNSTLTLDWPWVASDWANAVSLSTGITDGNASNARMLTSLILTKPELNVSMPSPAEALAVMAGCTLLMSSEYAPFQESFNYSQGFDFDANPQYQYFKASIRAQQYASGGVFPYQRAFFVVLFIIFLSNILVLVYFALHRGLVTDFTESPNLFTLAVNSPPSQLVAGSCGGGPHGEQYNVHWRVTHEGEHLYMTSEEGPRGTKRMSKPASVTSTGIQLHPPGDSPISRAFNKYRRQKSWL